MKTVYGIITKSFKYDDPKITDAIFLNLYAAEERLTALLENEEIYSGEIIEYNFDEQ